ncbi:MAG: phenylacetic acid degradation protein PaaN [Candidatus Velthaea sp.]
MNAVRPRAAEWLDTHRPTLENARATIRSRAYWSAYPEVPSGKVYGETAAADGKAAFEGRLHATFDLGQPGTSGTVATERSPYGMALDVAYPRAGMDALIAAAKAAMPAWSGAGADARTGVTLEMLARLNAHSFEIAHAVMHTTGQSFIMAFQAGGPHAQDRALEAVTYAYEEMSRVPERVVWEKPQGKAEPLRIEKTFALVPRGIDLTIGCSTFPNWNGYPGMFASLVTGNAVIVKPHPQAVLPLAITVEILRGTLADAGFDPNLVQLAVDSPEAPIAKDFARRPEIALVDYTGSTEFGTWLEENASGLVYTEKSGVNAVVIDSTADFKGMTRNLAMSFSLYAGQMCTTPQNVFVPRGGIATSDGHKSFDEVVAGIVNAIDGLLGAPERAVEVLGAIAGDATVARLDAENDRPGVVRRSAPLQHPSFPEARIRTPLIAKLDAADIERYDREMFGPIAYVIATDSTEHSLDLATSEAQRKGAITAILHSTDPAVVAAGERKAAEGRVSLAVNLTGALVVNQSAAFSDFHVTGGNPSGNASLTDAAFVANRFRIVETRRPAAG